MTNEKILIEAKVDAILKGGGPKTNEVLTKEEVLADHAINFLCGKILEVLKTEKIEGLNIRLTVTKSLYSSSPGESLDG